MINVLKHITHLKTHNSKLFRCVVMAITCACVVVIFILIFNLDISQALRGFLSILLGLSIHYAWKFSKPAEKNSATERNNTSAKLTTLFAGTFTVGTDIPPGRYVITSDSSGSFFVREKSGSIIIDTTLIGDDSEPHTGGVPSITTDIKEGQEIEISGINNVTFTPAVTQMSTVLTAGDWIVGLDIPPGVYNAFPTYEEAGNFFVRSAQGRSIVNEILNTTDRVHGVERVRVNLEVGQRIQMHNISSVTFEQP